MSTLTQTQSAPTSAAQKAVTEVFYTICPVHVASHVALELGWLEEEIQRAGGKLSYLRSLPQETGWLPHFSHRLDNLFRDGGNIPSIWAKADVTDTTLLGLTASPSGGQILVRVDSGLRRVADLRGRKVGLSKSLNSEKVDWWRASAERGIELALQLAGLQRSDVVIEDVAFSDGSVGSGTKPSELWARRRLKEDFSLNPEVQALIDGRVDAIYTNHGRSQSLERTGEFAVIEDLSRRPDWTLQVANSPWAITVNTELAKKNPEIVVAYLRAALRAGRWINANRAAAAEILHRVTFHPELADTVRAIADIDFVPNLSPRNLAGIEIEKKFLLSHGYIKRDFDVKQWAAPQFLEEAHRELSR
jgi:ABC-type nitrate/sulfonate/bicarbonate transport systems, periplasmic components